MKIVATVLLGPGAERVVGDAIRSARPHVDEFLLIESGGGQDALDAAHDAATGADTCITRYQWVGDYGEARQCALDNARALGFDYALTLDPDERLDVPDTFRPTIESRPDCDCWILADRDTGYFKERVIKCSSPVRWHGRVCEYLTGRDQQGAKLPGHFWELPKDDSGERRRWERGIAECARMIAEGDDCYRWRRHRGSCLMGLGRREDAFAEYQKALELAESPDDRAWMRYLLCEQLVLRERHEEARELAAKGLADHAGFIPEFGWILSYTDYQAGRAQNASRWAQLVVNVTPDRTRIGFRGSNCQKGARQILADLHRPKPKDEAA